MVNDNKIGWKFDNTYTGLPESMLTRLSPTPVKSPELVIINKDLSKELGLDFSKTNKEQLSSISVSYTHLTLPTICSV